MANTLALVICVDDCVTQKSFLIQYLTDNFLVLC